MVNGSRTQKKTHKLLILVLIMLTAIFMIPMAQEAEAEETPNTGETITLHIGDGSIDIYSDRYEQTLTNGTKNIRYFNNASKVNIIIDGESSGTDVAEPNTIIVRGGPHNITLQNITIEPGTYTGSYCAFQIKGDATVTLSGKNQLKSNVFPGLYVGPNADLTIKGNDDRNDTLTATTTELSASAGIGSSANSNCGSITIESGGITAIGGYTAAGIGGSGSGFCKNITINGGIIKAQGGRDSTMDTGAPGIGCGSKGEGGNVTITGGDITAVGGYGGVAPNLSQSSGIVAGTISSDGNTVIVKSSGSTPIQLRPTSTGLTESFNGIVWRCNDIDSNKSATAYAYGNVILSEKEGTQPVTSDNDSKTISYPKFSFKSGDTLYVIRPGSLMIPRDSLAFHVDGTILGDGYIDSNISATSTGSIGSGLKSTESLCAGYLDNETFYVYPVGKKGNETSPVYTGKALKLDGDILHISDKRLLEKKPNSNKDQYLYSDYWNWKTEVRRNNEIVPEDKIIHAGNYTIHFTHRYGLDTPFEIEVTIEQKKLTQNMVDYQRTYTYGEENEITIMDYDRKEKLVLGQDYTMSFTDAEGIEAGTNRIDELNVGDWRAIITGEGDYTTDSPKNENDQIEIDFSITPASLENAEITGLPGNLTYNARSQQSELNSLNVVLNGKTVPTNAYTLEYSNSSIGADITDRNQHLTYAGTVTVTADADAIENGNYIDFATGTFEIVPAALRIDGATASYTDADGAVVYARPYDGTKDVRITDIQLKVVMNNDKPLVQADYEGLPDDPDDDLMGSLPSADANKDGYRKVSIKNVKLKGDLAFNYTVTDNPEVKLSQKFQITQLLVPRPELSVTSKISQADSTTFACTVDVTNKPKGAEYQYRIDDGDWQDSNVFDQIKPQSKHTYYARAKTNDNMKPANEGEVGVLVYTTPKLPQEAPGSFTLSFEPESSGETFTATIPKVEGAVYSFDGINFNKSNVKKKCLPNTEYTGYIRFPETKEYSASDIVSDTQLTPMLQVKTPKISPANNTFYEPISVSITCATEGATIYYTTDGNYPSVGDDSNKYKGPFTISEDTTVTAVAIKEGMDDSESAQIDYIKTEYEAKAEVEYTDGITISNDLTGMSEDEIIAALSTAITKDGGGYNYQNIAFYNIRVKVSYDNGKSYDYATADNFPEDGVKIIMPYPAGTDKDNYNFRIAHMYSQNNDRLNVTAGDIEMPVPTETGEGLEFTVHGTSPLAIGWVASAANNDNPNNNDPNDPNGDGNGTDGNGNGIGNADPQGTPASQSGDTPAGDDGTGSGTGGDATGGDAGDGSALDKAVKAVRTGDVTNPYFWVPLLLLSCIIGIIAAFVRKRN